MSENDNEEPKETLQDALDQNARINGGEAISEEEFFEQLVEEMTRGSGKSETPDDEEPVIDQGNALNADFPEQQSNVTRPEYEGGIDYDFSDDRPDFKDSADDLQQLLDYVADEYGDKPIFVDETDAKHSALPIKPKSEERER